MGGTDTLPGIPILLLAIGRRYDPPPHGWGAGCFCLVSRLSKTDFRTMATLFRAAVMLSVLVGLPAAWIYYGPLPTGAQRVVDRFVAIAKEATGWKETEAKPAPTWDFTKSAPIVGEGLAARIRGDEPPGSLSVRCKRLLHRCRLAPRCRCRRLRPRRRRRRWRSGWNLCSRSCVSTASPNTPWNVGGATESSTASIAKCRSAAVR